MITDHVADERSPREIPPGVPAPGDIFAGKYRIEGVLGLGGMGAVLAARHLQLDEKVAIKVMLPGATDDGVTNVRFLREARAAVKIKGEHVPKVLDFGQLESGQPYMVMEYLVGEDLDAALRRRGPIPVEEAIDYILQACAAVVQAHALGIVHRDLKPGNLFLTRRDDGAPCVKVLDFGISKATGGDTNLSNLTLTKTRSTVGSPMYMAPEQMRTNRQLDARTDIWSLGIVSYQLMTGRVPFRSQTMPELCAMVLQDPMPPMELPGAPAELESVIRRCLEKNPDDRFPDLASFATALARCGSPSAADLALRVSKFRASREEDAGSGPVLPRSSPDSAWQSSPVISAEASAETQLSPSLPPPKIDGRTGASWTGAKESPRERKRGLALAGAAAVLLALGGVAVYVSRGHGGATEPTNGRAAVSADLPPPQGSQGAPLPVASGGAAAAEAPPSATPTPDTAPPVSAAASVSSKPQDAPRPASNPHRRVVPTPQPSATPPPESTSRTKSRYD
jgi:eukaryotic-like serine/threonine-protein kinase